MRFFPVFFFPRSGSTVVDFTLNQHPDILALNEPMNVWRATPVTKKYNLTYKEFMDPFITLKVKNAPRKKNVCFQHNLYDLKFFMEDVDFTSYFNFVKENFGSIVIFRRINILKQLISYERAYQTRVWHSTKSVQQPSEKINLSLFGSHRQSHFFPSSEEEPISLIEFIKLYELLIDDCMEKLKQSEMPFLDIVYEDHVETDPMVAVRLIEDFFKVEPYYDYTIPLVKTSTGLQHDLINYQEVCEYLSGTEFEWMLE